MKTPKILFPLVFLALTSTFGCQTIPRSATVEIPAAENPRDEALSKAVLGRLLAYNKADLSDISVVEQRKSIPGRDGQVFGCAAASLKNRLALTWCSECRKQT